MNMFNRGCTYLAALALAAPAYAQAQPEEEAPTEIVVEGMRNPDKEITNFIGALTDTKVRGQLSRFETAVCPGAVGLAAGQNRKVAARMRSVSKAAGIPVAKEGCAPNVYVVVAQDKHAMLKELETKYTDSRGDRVKAPKQSGPAIAWYMEGLLDADGVPAAVASGQEGTANHNVVEMGDGSSRLRPASRPHFLGSVLVVEPKAIEGLTTTQLADYAVMRLLARTDPSRLGKSAAPTILSLLDAPMGSAVPVTLTQWDLGFLKALYGSTEGRFANQQRNQMKRLLGKELQNAQKANDKK